MLIKKEIQRGEMRDRKTPRRPVSKIRWSQTQGRGRGVGRRADWETFLAIFISFQEGLWRVWLEAWEIEL